MVQSCSGQWSVVKWSMINVEFTYTSFFNFNYYCKLPYSILKVGGLWVGRCFGVSHFYNKLCQKESVLSPNIIYKIQIMKLENFREREQLLSKSFLPLFPILSNAIITSFYRSLAGSPEGQSSTLRFDLLLGCPHGCDLIDHCPVRVT